ncbi:MAG: tryptophan 7-halogenase [Rhodothermales bacterium]|nr:tryptophan 7-halogenase [Rhodothermales bacterium]MBO6780135.1 tryptophan 7-halogenase [Rhodothermales bacterium]
MRADLLIVGGGFAGSAMAMVAARLGLDVVLIDRGRHPRFAVGESTTPAGNMALAAMGRRYGIPLFTAMSRYGTWKEQLPEVDVGRKRGFAYWFHGSAHPELRVAASADDFHCDTHWLRSEVDARLFEEARAMGVEAWQETEIVGLHRAKRWKARLSCGRLVQARVLVDATGSAEFAARFLDAGRGPDMRIRTYAAFSHMRGLPPWGEFMDLDDDPFPAHESAQHHVTTGGWMWQLGFDSGVTSVGIVGPSPPDLSHFLSGAPSLAQQVEAASETRPWASTPRLQRRVVCAGGPDWLLLPASAGFVDPLHSTGIAHGLSAVERAAAVLAGGDSDFTALGAHILGELDHLDHLTAACYATLGRPADFVAATMLYFAASIRYEQDRIARGNSTPGFLGADDSALRSVVKQAPDRATTAGFADWVREAIAPWNAIGLMDPKFAHRYAHTAPRGW